MYLIRRVFIVKPETTREAAQIIAQIGKAYEKAGRSPTRVYWSGYTVPGPANTVYLDWTQETLGSPYDPDAKGPEGLGTLYDQIRKLYVDTYIEFYEMV
jgi:hypothetical protein